MARFATAVPNMLSRGIQRCCRIHRLVPPLLRSTFVCVIIAINITSVIWMHHYIKDKHTNISANVGRFMQILGNNENGEEITGNVGETSGNNTQNEWLPGIERRLIHSISEDRLIALETKWSRSVLFIWCGGTTFTFKNYLSARSVVLHTNPSHVVFVYSTYPNVVETDYNTWFMELKESVPFWSERKYNDTTIICKARNPSQDGIKRIAKDIGYPVLFVGSSTIFRRPFEASDPMVNVNGYDENTGHGFYLLANPAVDSPFKDSCPTVNISDPTAKPDKCFSLATDVNPEDVMYLKTAVGADLRKMFYGSEDMPYPAYDSRTSAPRVAHYIWIGSAPMQVTFYLSILSSLCVAELQKVCIHSDHVPSGEYWKRLQDREDLAHRIHYIPWVKPELVFSQQIKKVEHLADVIKSTIMFQHGGVMMDPDLLFAQKLPDELFHYEALFTVGILPYRDFPDIFNMGISISKPRSEFARLWLESEKRFIDSDWNWNCGRATYKLWERNPKIAKVDRRLQLLCGVRCYPFWLPDKGYKKTEKYEGDPMQGVNWRTDVWSIHFPQDPFENKAIEKDRGIAGELARVILRAANMLESNKTGLP